MITKVVWDADLRVVEVVEVPYSGPWALAKGERSKQEQALANARLAQQDATAQQQLMMQQGQINMVNPTLQRIIAAGGLTPETEAAMRTTALSTLPDQYRNLYSGLSSSLRQRGITGGQFAGGGQIAQGFGALGAEQARTQANLLNNVQLQKEQGLYNAMGTTLGIGGMYGQNYGTATGGGSSSLNTGQQAAKAADEASTSFWGSLLGAVGGVASSAVRRPG